MEAGCKAKNWLLNEVGFAYDEKAYDWIPAGLLLEDGVCVGDGYTKHVLPESAKRYIATTIEYQKLRNVDAMKETVSVDLALTMRWSDPDIKVQFSNEDLANGGIILGPEATYKIWSPDIHIENRTYFKFDEEWKSLRSSKILTTGKEVELRYEMKFTVYCKFDHFRYPMDEQACPITIGSASKSAIFVLYPPPNGLEGSYHVENTYQADNFDVSVKFYDENMDNGRNTIGMRLKLGRLQHSYIFMYYIPCTTIVLVSLIGFMVPLTAIPGRVCLLVTQFLTLINLLIYQMVKILNDVYNLVNDLFIFFHNDIIILQCEIFLLF